MPTSQKNRKLNVAVEKLAAAIGQATRSAKFVVSGSPPVADPDLVVEGLGRVSVPLKRVVAKSLIAACQVAPYGKGTETLVDTRVRKTFELDLQKFQLGDSWNSAIADATRTVADELGLPAEELEAKLYKLLVYEKGGFFLLHRDSEKHDQCVEQFQAGQREEWVGHFRELNPPYPLLRGARPKFTASWRASSPQGVHMSPLLRGETQVYPRGCDGE